MLSGQVVLLYEIGICKAFQAMNGGRPLSPPSLAELFVKVALPSMVTPDCEAPIAPAGIQRQYNMGWMFEDEAIQRYVGDARPKS